ncbi:MAG: Smr/MutS family protein [Spirochaetota bacterium]|nr:Smr/MutS family protein [Spirochaetota bacterium]
MEDEVIRIELDDELDLHPFHPQDVKGILLEFIQMALAKDIKRIRIAHGKGKSAIKGVVIRILQSNDNVISFHDEPGNWGATIAFLR